MGLTHLLDSSTCVAYLRGGRTSPVACEFERRAASEIALCSVVVAELVYGALRSNRPESNLASLNTFFSRFVSLPFDDACAEHCARIRADLASRGTPIGPHDLLIAAIGLHHDLVVATHNTAEFSRVSGLHVEDWTRPGAGV